ncbi:MAG: hypothetical protein IKS15_05205 [Opitutales bacterium]|nr:hypothetical protein [Opitutales bacterium]
MKKIFNVAMLGAAAAALCACGLIEESIADKSGQSQWEFGLDLAFLEKYADCVVLGEGESFVAVSPKLQARVMTSTLGGEEGMSIGWINRGLIASKNPESHMNLYGGEDRFWIGPEGTEHSVFFEKGALFVPDNWKIPQEISAQPWKVKSANRYQASFEKEIHITSARGEKFDILASREISFISKENAQSILKVEIPESVKMVAFQSANKATNIGARAWGAETGYINLAVVSTFHANKTTYGFIPFNQGDPKNLGTIITDLYNESPIGDRLSVAADFVRMRLDGAKLGEIFMNPRRSRSIMGFYDSDKNLLTIIAVVPPASQKKYLVPYWRRTNDMLDGDALGLFNNGPANHDTFYADKLFKATTFSPALALKPQKSQLHIQRTFHFCGSEYELEKIAQKLLGVGIKDLRP